MSGLATRREFLAAAGTAGAALRPATALAARSRPSTGRDVAVFGAGVAGLTAAHELAERGFRVTVYERDHLGGKAWSVGVPGSGSGGRSPRPGEHGFRFFPGFYKCLGDTMRRIPSARGGTAYDRLVGASTCRTSFAGCPDLTTPLGPPRRPPTPDTFAQSLAAAIVEAQMLPPYEALYFASKLGVYVTSCDERRLQQWERVSWKDFIREDTGGLTNTTPLFIQHPGSWYDRSDSGTDVPNLFLAGEWVRTNINVTTMDGANQGGRQAANALLEAAGSRKPPAEVRGLHRPPEYEAFKRIDRERFRRGPPHAFDPDQQAPGA